MTAIKVASRYAKALLELAVERNALDAVLKDVKKLITLSAENRGLVLMFDSPIVNTEKKGNVLKALFEKDGHQITMNFFEIVTRKNRSNVLVATAKEFIRQYNQHMGIQIAEVTTTAPLTADLRARFITIVKEISGKAKVELEEKIDPNLIGGFVLKVDDRVLDDSLSGKLRDLRLGFAQRYFVKLY
jgi:F-type H+-transporting ATPase subunit delta